jgi:tRNA pseudouridine55 synthase
LAEDIGKELGTGAHLAELRRTRAGNFDLSQAVTLEELENLAAENKIGEVLVSPHRALAHLPEIVLDENAARKTLNGMKLFLSEMNVSNNQFVRMCDESGNLLAVGIFDENGQSLQPRVVLASNE